jgi:dTDP-4-dehydrorhamnose reductase
MALLAAILSIIFVRGVDIIAPEHAAVDVLDAPALGAAFAGADTVIHNAAATN